MSPLASFIADVEMQGAEKNKNRSERENFAEGLLLKDASITSCNFWHCGG